MRITIASTASSNKNKYAVDKITEFLLSKGIEGSEFSMEVENIYTVDLETLQSADLIILIGQAPDGLTVPVIDGTAFLARVPFMEHETCNKIYSLIQTHKV